MEQIICTIGGMLEKFPFTFFSFFAVIVAVDDAMKSFTVRNFTIV